MMLLSFMQPLLYIAWLLIKIKSLLSFLQEEVAKEAETGKIYRADYYDKCGRTVLILRPGFQVLASVLLHSSSSFFVIVFTTMSLMIENNGDKFIQLHSVRIQNQQNHRSSTWYIVWKML